MADNKLKLIITDVTDGDTKELEGNFILSSIATDYNEEIIGNISFPEGLNVNADMAYNLIYGAIHVIAEGSDFSDEEYELLAHAIAYQAHVIFLSKRKNPALLEILDMEGKPVE